MLSETHFRVPRSEGVHTIQRRGEGGARELTTRRITLSPGGSVSVVEANEETVVVLLQGRGRFVAADRSWEVARAGVFAEPASSLLLPPGVDLAVHAETDLEAVLTST